MVASSWGQPGVGRQLWPLWQPRNVLHTRHIHVFELEHHKQSLDVICQQGMAILVFTYPWVGRHQGVRSERRGPIGWEGLGLGDEGVVALVVDSGVYEPAVHAPGAVPCESKRQVRGPDWYVTQLQLPLLHWRRQDTQAAGRGQPLSIPRPCRQAWTVWRNRPAQAAPEELTQDPAWCHESSASP